MRLPGQGDKRDVAAHRRDRRGGVDDASAV
jgi:hypothetical protein